MGSSIFNLMRLEYIGKRVIVTTPFKVFEGKLYHVDDSGNLTLVKGDRRVIFIIQKYCSSIEVLVEK